MTRGREETTLVSENPIPERMMLPRPTIEAFDALLDAGGLQLEAILVGGPALALLGVTARPTRDFDILAPELPAVIVDAARRFAREQRRLGLDLADDWLNNGPIQLRDVLPTGWRDRVQLIFQGRALRLHSLGRLDLLKTKLYALCDRGTDLADCLAMAPTDDECASAQPWLELQDANPDWPAHVAATLHDLRRRLGHGV